VRAEDPRPMKIVSLNTGLPRKLTWRGRSVTTAIVRRIASEPTTTMEDDS